MTLEYTGHGNDRERMRENDRETIVSSNGRHSRPDLEHKNGREPHFSPHHFSREQNCANDRHSSESSDFSSHRTSRDSLRENGRNSTGGSGTMQHQYKSKGTCKSNGERYNPLKMTFVKQSSGEKAMKSPKQYQSVTQADKSCAREDKQRLSYYKQPKTGHFECPVCQNTFSARQSLINHMKNLHDKHKLPTYLQPGNRSYSLRIISKFKSKSCSVCDIDYDSPAKLKSHLATRHGIDIHPCPYPSCTHVFLVKKNLDDHQMEAHFIDVNISF